MAATLALVAVFLLGVAATLQQNGALTTGQHVGRREVLGAGVIAAGSTGAAVATV